jgi:hypothetical protein
MSDPEDDGLGERLERVEELVHEIERFPDEGLRERAREIVETVLDLHGAALARILEAASGRGDPGRELIEAIASDEIVSSVLVLHDLHPRDLEGRVRAALERVRTGLVLRGARAELLAVGEGAIRVRVVRETAGCGSETPRLKALVEEAVERAAPDAISVEVEVTTAPTKTFIPIERLREARGGELRAARPDLEGGA